MPSGHRTTARSLLAFLAMWALAGTLAAGAGAAPPKRIVFPVVGPVSYTDDFGAPRGDHRHRGNDIMAKRWAPVVAVEGGEIERPRWSSSDCTLILHGASGTEYWYLHLNDLARDGDFVGCKNGVSFARGLANGDPVKAGELIGFVGNSGNARGGGTHLHFELHPSGRGAVSPYRWLRSGRRLLFPRPAGNGDIRVALYGHLVSAAESLALRVDRVAVARLWRGRTVRRQVELAYAPAMAVERMTEAGSLSTAALSGARAGERISVWTPSFRPTLGAQLGRPGTLLAERVRLRGL